MDVATFFEIIDTAPAAYLSVSSNFDIAVFQFIKTPGGEPGLNYLCEGFRDFFNHIDGPMRFMAGELAARRPPANIIRKIRLEDEARLEREFARAGRNDACPCGSGKKFKHCHGG